MCDKYSDMTDEKIAAWALAMMGYEKVSHSHWWYKGMNEPIHQYWALRTGFGNPHRLAAAVRGWMTDHGWSCSDEFCVSRGHVHYWRAGHYNIPHVTYHNMEQHPRAVCEAALRAIAAEREAENDT